jgi:hypothetical protein
LTPQEIFEYKLRWRPGTACHLHSDLFFEGREWCKEHLPKKAWHFETWTDNYQHTFFFEYAVHAEELAAEYPEYARVEHFDF